MVSAERVNIGHLLLTAIFRELRPMHRSTGAINMVHTLQI